MFTGVNLLPDAVERLATHPNIVGMKESGSDIGQIADFVARTPDDFTVLAGSATTLYHALCAGCDGGDPGAGVAAARRVRADARARRAIGGSTKRTRCSGSCCRSRDRSAARTACAGLKAALDLHRLQRRAAAPPLRPAAVSQSSIPSRGQLEELAAVIPEHART